MATLEFLATYARATTRSEQWMGNRLSFLLVRVVTLKSIYFKIVLCLAFSAVQTFLFRFKFKAENLIILGVSLQSLHQNKENDFGSTG